MEWSQSCAGTSAASIQALFREDSCQYSDGYADEYSDKYSDHRARLESSGIYRNLAESIGVGE